ncbi:NADH dehydrogenase [ubiquinone] 1 beta subcomplex subunit 8, mitochondrial-like [Saccoglossus kowalevskii]|uniref:NADH dehydrogenase [ubiquinone] 1 beta subcomplex subunit 8, mitochondrial-like n=1 Tax=Saccoglossus kowalevskii TaxID=10224 RepID=A0ABM0GSI0_SACKO|nr:PREDICTED: NADH dehydrogenase [ubiquinone] 1 beta subcomplex subunit 8, mitochondrial-like [Saccoglossus kowalevskii]
MASQLCRAVSKLRPALLVNRGAVALQTGNRMLSKDEMPGPYPRTPAERARAAKKYNMRVEDYEPYPDDGTGWGDYPKLSSNHVSSRSNWDDWDFPEIRRNYGDVYHIDEDIMWRNRPFWDKQTNPPFKIMAAQLFGFLTAIGVLFYLGSRYINFRPVAPKQYPYNNLYLEKGGDPEKMPEPVKHYEF